MMRMDRAELIEMMVMVNLLWLLMRLVEWVFHIRWPKSRSFGGGYFSCVAALAGLLSFAWPNEGGKAGEGGVLGWQAMWDMGCAEMAKLAKPTQLAKG